MVDLPRGSASLRRRLMLALLGGAAVLAVLFFVVLRGYAQQVAQQSQDRVLEASVRSVLDAVVVREGAVELDLPYAAFAILETWADDRVFYALHQGGDLLTGYEGLVPETRGQSLGLSFATVPYRDTIVRRVSATQRFPASPRPILLTASVAQTRDSLSGTLLTISTNAALFGAAFFLLAAGMAVWVSSATLRPLSRIAASVAQRGPRDLRPVKQSVPTELSPLVSSLNALMTRLNQSLTQSETFIAEAAHRVRTPLATVRTHAETTLQRVDRDENRQALRSMIRAIDESSRAAGQLLDHAMVTFRGDQMEKAAVDLVSICRDGVARLTPVAEMKDLALVLEAREPVQVMGDAILIENAVRNLIDNALKYSPPEKTVWIRVNADPAPNVAVIDEGPGFPKGQIESLSLRFQRGENAKNTVGSGLGLTIAKDVAEAHDGRLKLSNSSGGGACAQLFF